jgi:hypothetical protein
MIHECRLEKYGYECPICHEARMQQARKELIEGLMQKWNGNCDIFDIYEELKEDYEDDHEMLDEILNRAFQFFSNESLRALFCELAGHFDVTIKDEVKE